MKLGLEELLKKLIPNQADEIISAVRCRIPIMIINNTGSGREMCKTLNHLLKENNAIVVPDTVSEFREYNTAYLLINLNEVGKMPKELPTNIKEFISRLDGITYHEWIKLQETINCYFRKKENDAKKEFSIVSDEVDYYPL